MMKRHNIYILFVLLLFFFYGQIFSSSYTDGKKKYWIFFKDKGDVSLYKAYEKQAESIISERSIKRRKKIREDARIIDETDFPVNSRYIERLKSMKIEVLTASKWLNGVSAYLSGTQKRRIEYLRFVRAVKPVNRFVRKPLVSKKAAQFKTAQPDAHIYDYGLAYTQNNQINVPRVHDLGITGKNILIGMLDTGYNMNHECLEKVNILAEWDFINNDAVTANEQAEPVSQHKHGTQTLACIGAFRDGKMIGTAFDAAFVLGKTEIVNIEYAVEEDNWVRGIEWMDSLGVDIVSSSLGYSDRFTDRSSYTFSDLDGKTAITTIAAEIAADKGIVVVNSAGNERATSWGHIITPADGENVIAVGAVNSSGILAYFSSPGPTADGRLKPDVVAMGSNITVPFFDNSDNLLYDRYDGGISGTSFSAPITAGVCALILSAHPYMTPAQVREALTATADRASNPNNDYGYGLVDAYKAVLHSGTVFSNSPDIEVIEGNKYRITTNIVSPNGLPENAVSVYYTYSHNGGGFQNAAMQKTDESYRYYADIPMALFGARLFYYFSAVDSSDTETVNPYNAPNGYFSYLSPFSEELRTFSYSIQTRKFVRLQWAMHYEVNNLGFDVERSLDNIVFEKIAHIPGKGTSSIEQDYSYTDSQTNTGAYYYRLKRIKYDGSFEYSNILEAEISAPGNTSVSQNYPNPFNTGTTIQYQLLNETNVTITIYDVLGRHIRTLTDETKSVGFYEEVWNGTDEFGRDVASGTYFYKFSAGSITETRKITFLK
ncbi:S8 family serine peptidase [candidate division KSB1 bacterium]